MRGITAFGWFGFPGVRVFDFACVLVWVCWVCAWVGCVWFGLSALFGLVLTCVCLAFRVCTGLPWVYCFADLGLGVFGLDLLLVWILVVFSTFWVGVLCVFVTCGLCLSCCLLRVLFSFGVRMPAY